MSVADEIENAREKYRQRKGQQAGLPAPQGPKRQQNPALPPAKGTFITHFREYLQTYMAVLRRDILFRLGIQTKSDEEIERMKMEYREFMERFGK